MSRSDFHGVSCVGVNGEELKDEDPGMEVSVEWSYCSLPDLLKTDWDASCAGAGGPRTFRSLLGTHRTIVRKLQDIHVQLIAAGASPADFRVLFSEVIWP